ncbi:YadA C-terminal domain-containing protein [Providencia rustigianii]|uniref:YadA C-terminal domain-containing protein n=1 Tax=Providencia rustigianii TaxID=158850 RepID=UPI000F7018BD|nr:YadA C-terminal domain-containing protein [Providencia rustigianii]VEH55090.1 YadA-like C-terminal region [Providencia rustigianii]
MKKKVLLNHVCVLLLSSLSVPSLALGSIEELKAAINDPDNNYPEHNHTNDNILQLAEKVEPVLNLGISILENIINFPNEVESPELSAPSATHSTYQQHVPPYAFPNGSIPESTLPPKNIYNLSSSPANQGTLSLQKKLADLDNDVKDNLHELNLLNMSVNDLNSHIQKNNQKHLADNKTTINTISNLENTLSTLKKNLKDSNKNTSLSIDEAEKNSKAHADLILHDQQKLNIERFDKLDKQNYLHARQFKQINAKFDHLESKIHQTARDANAGIAAVAAMTNIPYTSGTRFSAGLGMGNFKNGKAIAAGAQYQVKQNLNLRSSISWNNSDSAVIGAGVAYGW